MKPHNPAHSSHWAFVIPLIFSLLATLFFPASASPPIHLSGVPLPPSGVEETASPGDLVPPVYIPLVARDYCGGQMWTCSYNPHKNLYLGAVVADYLAIRDWNRYWKQADPLALMRQNGFEWVRVGVTTRSDPYLSSTPANRWHTLPWRDSYWGSQEYAGQILKEAAAQGYRLNLFFFLSHKAADSGVQDAPPEWANLSLEQTASALDAYTYATTQYYLEQGLNIELYEIGNEIEWGILNFRPNERIVLPPGVDKTTDMDYMRDNIWDKEAYLLKSAIQGVKRADADAKIVLHINSLMSFYNNDVLNREFFRYMVDQDVPFDYAGLSLPYPRPIWVPGDFSTTEEYYQRAKQTIDLIQSLNKPVIISEAAYHHSWYETSSSPLAGYPFTPTGQANWVRDHLRFASNHPNVAGFFYFYPDWFPRSDPGIPQDLQTLGLFASDTQIMPAMLEFRVNLH